MMKRINYTFLLITLVMIFNSCKMLVTKGGNVTGGPLLNIDDRYVDIARGEARINDALVLKDATVHSVISEAKVDMYKNRPLKTNEYYSNFSVEWTVIYYPRFFLRDLVKIEVAVSADVLKQKDTTSFSSFVKVNSEAMVLADLKQKFTAKGDTFSVGEVVYSTVGGVVGKYDRMEIIYITGDQVNLKYLEKKASNVLVKYSKYEYYSVKKSNSGYRSGDRVLLMSAYDKTKTVEATVLGVSKKLILVSTASGAITVPPERLK